VGTNRITGTAPGRVVMSMVLDAVNLGGRSVW